MKNDLVFNRQPSLYVALAQMLVAGASIFWLNWDNTTQVLVVAVVNTGLGFVVALRVRENAYPAFVAVTTAILNCAIGFGLPLNDDQKGWLLTSLPAVVAFFVWPSVHPKVPPVPEPLIVDSSS